MSSTVTGLNPKTGEVLLGMGYTSPTDFLATAQEDGTVTVIWNAATPMPSAAEIDAAAPMATETLGTHNAQQAKARAIDAVDKGELKEGLANDRALVSVVLMALDEFNLHSLKIKEILDAVDAATSLADLKSRVALIADHPQRTKQQLYNAVKAKIAGTAE